MIETKKGTKEEAGESVTMPHRGGRNTLITIGTLVVIMIVIAAVFATGILGSPSSKAVTLTGAGATFPMPLILKWASEYYNVTKHKVAVNYGGGGSGAGITQIETKHVDFAGSDAPLSVNDTTTYGFVHIPETLGPIVVAYNEPSIQTLKLDGPTLAEIFMKNITAWNDPAIAALNSGVTLPAEKINVIFRSDQSGTTDNFQKYLTGASDGTWTKGVGKTFNGGVGEGAKGNEGTSAAIKSTEGSITYNEWSFATAQGLQMASIVTSAGNISTKPGSG